jgi:hypothetical protein
MAGGLKGNNCMETEKLKTKEKPIRGKNGGKRPGSGRKPKKTFEARELFNKKIDERWDDIIKNIDFFIKKKDKDILKFIVEQRIGKSAQSLNLGGDINNPITIIVKKDDGNKGSKITPKAV